MYLKIKNIGVSQNWQQVATHMKVTSSDVLICADPDERVHNDGWVKALATVMRKANKDYGWVSLVMPEHMPILNAPHTKLTKTIVEGYNVWEVHGNLNWAQGAMSGKLLSKMGTVPIIKGYPVYGYLEAAMLIEMAKHNFTWCMLPDFKVSHTDDVPLYRSWKDCIIFEINKYGQISFEKWLNMQKVATL